MVPVNAHVVVLNRHARSISPVKRQSSKSWGLRGVRGFRMWALVVPVNVDGVSRVASILQFEQD